MRWISGLIAGGGVGAFFFFSWVIQMLWNNIVVGHLGLFKALNYWQAAGLWFLIILLSAWTGIGANKGLLSHKWRSED
ncbi:TPA: hypothetical protein DIT45_01265 [Candidatus Acetothermia bacterium]|nr:hypothetical protein [Candidatus Acetothermia bacterium]